MKREFQFVSGTGITVTPVDNADGTQTVTVTATGGGGGSFTAGGDLSGTSTSQQVLSVTGSAGDVAVAASSFTWSAGLIPVLTQSSNATSHDFTIRPQAASTTGNANGNFVVDLQVPPSTGNYGYFEVTRAASGPIARIGPVNNNVALSGLWLGVTGTSFTNNNAVILTDGAYAQIQCPSLAGTLYFYAGNAVTLATMTSPSSNGTNFALGSSGSSSFGGAVGAMRMDNAFTTPSTNPTTGGVLYENGGSLSHRGSGGATVTMAPSGAGTPNTQQMSVDRRLAVVRTTSNTSFLIDVIPVATSGSTCLIEYKLLGRDTSTGAAFSEIGYFLFKNVAGTVSQTVFANAPGLDASVPKQYVANTSPGSGAYISVTVSGTNLQLSLAPLTADTSDWELLTETLYC